MNKKLIQLLVVIICMNSYAQINFEDHIISGPNNFEIAAHETRSVYSADIDGDGDNDILSASLKDDKIAWYENLDGLGNFGTQQIISNSVDGAYSVIASDLDGDGDLDVLSTSVITNIVAWHENLDGLGTFGSQQIIDSIYSESLYISDLDSDGDMDVLSALSIDDKIVWYKNLDGLGNFGTQQIISSDIDNPSSVFAEDFDGDGDIDVLSATSSNINHITWYENTNGLGNFEIEHVIDTGVQSIYSVYASDIDNDGDIDVLASGLASNEVIWFENENGLGDFGILRVISSSSNRQSYSVYAGDIDGDSDIDVITASPVVNEIVWHENIDGQGNFAAEQIITRNANGAISVYLKDINGDGNLDALSASYVDDKIAWYDNTDGIGNFGTEQVLTPNIQEPSSVYSCDLDSDGDLDILTTFYSDHKVSWFENLDGNGNFGIEQIITINAFGAWSVYCSDLDSDGDMDVLTASIDDYKIAWHENLDGLGNFGPQQVLSSNIFEAHTVLATDIDGDGDMDVIGAGSGDNKIAWYENLDGLGNFGYQQILTEDLFNGNTLTSALASDIDGDGDIDVIYTRSGSNTKIAWFENTDGMGNFDVEQVITQTFSNPSDVHSVDIDGDNDLDLVLASLNNNKIAWLENIDGFGNFGSEQIISLNALGANKVYTSDIDGDGDMDVLSASRDDNKVAWYENNDGQGGFSDELIITINADFSSSVYTGDINGDNNIDVLSISRMDGKVVWHENSGLLSLSESNIENFLVYPNPASKLLTIESNTSIYSVSIYNQLGQLISVMANANNIDISKLNVGIYFFEIEDVNGNIETKRIIKK